jgi:hypothetical protein
MRLEDAPAAGWYPDPERSGNVRWWEGTDWSDAHRLQPTTTKIEYDQREAIQPVKSSAQDYVPRGDLGAERLNTDEMVDQVRVAAREEVQRAADVFSDRSRTAVRSLQRVIGDYVGTAVRWIRIALFVGAVVIIAWFVLQLFVQASIFDWVGDRIDNIGDN